MRCSVAVLPSSSFAAGRMIIASPNLVEFFMAAASEQPRGIAFRQTDIVFGKTHSQPHISTRALQTG